MNLSSTMVVVVNARGYPRASMATCCSNPKILFVDDSRTMLFVLRAHLSGCNFEFLEAPDGMTAMRCAMKVRPSVIISDVEMPGVSGIDLCRLVRSAPGLMHTRLILISSKWTTARRREVESIGVDGMLPKPIDPDMLKQLVMSLVVGGSK